MDLFISRMQVLKELCDLRDSMLTDAANNINDWMFKVVKSQSVYFTLNLFNNSASIYSVAEAWIPVSDLESVDEALQRGAVMAIFLFLKLTT